MLSEHTDGNIKMFNRWGAQLGTEKYKRLTVCMTGFNNSLYMQHINREENLRMHYFTRYFYGVQWLFIKQTNIYARRKATEINALKSIWCSWTGMQKSCGLTTPRFGKSMQMKSAPCATNTHSNKKLFQTVQKTNNLTHHFSSSETIVSLKEEKETGVSDVTSGKRQKAKTASCSIELTSSS